MTLYTFFKTCFSGGPKGGEVGVHGTRNRVVKHFLMPDFQSA